MVVGAGIAGVGVLGGHKLGVDDLGARGEGGRVLGVLVARVGVVVGRAGVGRRVEISHGGAGRWDEEGIGLSMKMDAVEKGRVPKYVNRESASLVWHA